MKKMISILVMLLTIQIVSSQQIDSVTYEFLPPNDSELSATVYLSYPVENPRELGFQVSTDSSFGSILHEETLSLPFGGLYPGQVGFAYKELDTLPPVNYFARAFLQDVPNNTFMYSSVFTFIGKGTPVSVAKKENSLISIYPNPTQNNLTVSGVTTPYQLSLFDITGKTVMTEARNGGSGGDNFALDLQPGLYYYVVQEGTRQKNGRIAIK